MPFFKLLVGKHVADDMDGVERRYKPGDIIETESNLIELFNSPGCRKFEEVEAPKQRMGEKTNLPRPGKLPEKPDKAPVNPLMQGEDTPEKASKQTTEKSDLEKPNATKPAAAVAANQAKLESLTEQELRAIAAEEEIDLKGVRGREAVLKAVKKHLE